MVIDDDDLPGYNYGVYSREHLFSDAHLADVREQATRAGYKAEWYQKKGKTLERARRAELKALKSKLKRARFWPYNKRAKLYAKMEWCLKP